MYAGGLSYLSSGLAERGFDVGACPEAVASATTEVRQINMLAVETLKELMSVRIANC
jgi:hypothetical protein